MHFNMHLRSLDAEVWLANEPNVRAQVALDHGKSCTTTFTSCMFSSTCRHFERFVSSGTRQIHTAAPQLIPDGTRFPGARGF